MRRYSKQIYILITVTAGLCLFGSYIPGLQFLASWCTPPVMLFLGLAYVSVVGNLVIGMLIGRKLLKVDKETSYLISSGTAICG